MAGGGGISITTHDDIEKQVIPCGVSQAAPLFPIANGSLIMPFQVDPNGALFVRPSGGQVPADALPTPATSADSTSYTMVWNGLSWDRALEGNDAPVQGVSSTGQLAVINKNLTFDGANWYRMTSLNDNIDGNAPTLGRGSVATGSKLYAFNSAGNFDRLRCGSDNLDAQIGGQGSLSVQAKGFGWVGNTWNRLRTPNIFKTVTVTAAGISAVWTPTIGFKFRLMGYSIEITGNAIQAVAGNFEITLLDAAAAIGIGSSLYVPAAALNIFGSNALNPINIGNGYLSDLANNALNVNLSAALTGGEIRVTVWGTEE